MLTILLYYNNVIVYYISKAFINFIPKYILQLLLRLKSRKTGESITRDNSTEGKNVYCCHWQYEVAAGGGSKVLHTF